MDRYRLGILGLSEVRWKGHGEFRPTSGHSLFYSGNNDSHTNGVGFLLTQNTKKALIEYNPVSDRIIVARFRTKFRNISVIQCYAPTEPDVADIKNRFYEQLNATIAQTRKSDIKMVIGDFNAKVGSDNSNIRSIMGNQGLGTTRNDNGERLVDLCSTHQLFIGGTKFIHRDIHKYTWQSPDGNTRNQIDHFIISRRFLGSLLDVNTIRGADIFSDHQLLVGIVKLRPFANYHQPKLSNKINIHRLKDSSTLQAFETNLSTKLTNTNNWSDIKAACLGSARQTLGYIKHHRAKWISEDTWSVIEDRRKAKQQLQAAQSSVSQQVLRTEYTTLEKQVKKMVRKDRRQFYDTIAEEAEYAASRGNMRGLYDAVKKISAEKVLTTPNIKTNNGLQLTTIDGQLNRWKQFFESSANEDPFIPFNFCERRNPCRSIPTTPPTLEEVKMAIGKLKNNKSAGLDNIPPELFKATNIMALSILPLIQNAWSSCELPSEWNDGVIVTIPKKGDLSECSNWRGITLLNTIQKILAFIILERISPVVESSLRREQAGFRPNRSCVDQINSLRIIVEQSVEFNSPLFLLFVDFKRAFDTINRNAIWYCLRHIGIPEMIIALVKELYRDASCKVRFKGHDSASFNINKGVRQGCVLSPILFLIVLDYVMVQTNKEAPDGIQWHLNQRLHDLDYADDICMMSHAMSGIQHKLNRLKENALRVGLEINVPKTKLMRLKTNNTAPIFLNNERISEVQKFCYLGSIITTDGGADDDVSSRINKARHAFASLGKVWQSSRISNKHKIRIFNASVKSVLLYSCETWKVTDNIVRRLQTFVNKCLRRILRIFWPQRISNVALLSICNSEEIYTEVCRRKWSWVGHTLRKDVADIARKSFEWNPQGNRSRGRPKLTWRRSIDDECNRMRVTWPQIKLLAQNRQSWRVFVNNLCVARSSTME